MYARLLISQMNPGTLDEALQIFRGSVLENIRQQPGYQGALALVDRSAHETISITLWQTEAEAQLPNGHKEAHLNIFDSHLAEAPVVEILEVVVKE